MLVLCSCDSINEWTDDNFTVVSKLSFEYFRKLVTENKLEDIKIVLAGILYLEPDETKVVLSTIERDFSKLFIEMKEEQLKIAYNILIKHASLTIRKFSINAPKD